MYNSQEEEKKKKRKRKEKKTIQNLTKLEILWKLKKKKKKRVCSLRQTSYNILHSVWYCRCGSRNIAFITNVYEVFQISNDCGEHLFFYIWCVRNYNANFSNLLGLQCKKLQ